jgi:hypothetical protein
MKDINLNRWSKLAGINEEESTPKRDIESRVAQIYAVKGVKTEYEPDPEIIKYLGEDAMELAKQMAPKIIAYQEKLKSIITSLENSPEGKILAKYAKEKAEQRGNSYGYVATIDNMANINLFTK